MTGIQIFLLVLGIVLFVGLLVSVILTMYIASRVFAGTLVRKNKDHWGRKVSFPDIPEIVTMWNIGLKWAEDNKEYKNDVSIQSFDGLKLVGEFYNFGFKRSVIILPGRCESLCYSYYYAESYKLAGLNVLVIDSRAHGLSEGKYNTCGIKESKDINSWAQYLNNNWQQEKISLHGICVGGCGALMAMTSKDKSPYLDKLVVDGLFISFKKIYALHMKEQGHNLFPVFYEIWIWFRLKNHVNINKSNPLKLIKKLNNEVLFIYSKKDQYSLDKNSNKLYQLCPSKKEIHWFENGAHSRVRLSNTEEYNQTIIKFFN